MGWALNWFGIILDIIVPICAIVGMIAVIIHDRRKKKRRQKRCKGKISYYTDLKEG